MNPNPTAPHDPDKCRPCGIFKHPLAGKAREQLVGALPSQRTPMDGAGK
ncbi:hypothetical protein ACH4RG_23505 [Streptomyces sp. NPDC021019]